MAEERATNTTLQRQLAELTARVHLVACDVGEIKTMLHQIEERVRRLENNEAGAHPLMESRINSAWQKLEEHDKRIEAITQIVTRLDHSNRIMTWVAGILGSTLIIWLITQILGAIK